MEVSVNEDYKVNQCYKFKMSSTPKYMFKQRRCNTSLGLLSNAYQTIEVAKPQQEKAYLQKHRSNPRRIFTEGIEVLPEQITYNMYTYKGQSDIVSQFSGNAFRISWYYWQRDFKLVVHSGPRLITIFRISRVKNDSAYIQEDNRVNCQTVYISNIIILCGRLIASL